MTAKNWTPTIVHVEPSKKRVRLEAMDALHILAAHHLPYGEHEQALHYARRLLELEPWHEGAAALPCASSPAASNAGPVRGLPPGAGRPGGPAFTLSPPHPSLE